jgi:two-component system response regulator YesN
MENKNDKYHATIQLAIEYIEDHFGESITVENIADVVQLNKDYFSHIFKKSIGESFTDYLNKRRIEEAKKLLLQKKYKIYEIADMVGYSDYKYFSKVFKKLVGISPNKFIKMNV